MQWGNGSARSMPTASVLARRAVLDQPTQAAAVLLGDIHRCAVGCRCGPSHAEAPADTAAMSSGDPACTRRSTTRSWAPAEAVAARVGDDTDLVALIERRQSRTDDANLATDVDYRTVIREPWRRWVLRSPQPDIGDKRTCRPRPSASMRSYRPWFRRVHRLRGMNAPCHA
jgi:hypothetical protein